MALNLPEMENIFPFSKERSQGLGAERIGQATIIVALDGTGDTTSIQEGIDMLPAGGGVVYVKEGTYNTTSPITITGNNIYLTGAGFSTIIQNTGLIDHIVTISGTDCMLQNLFLNAISYDTNQGAEITGDRTIIDNCKVAGNGSNNIRINGASDCIVSNSIISGSANHGINLFGTADNIIISNCICTGNNANGIQMGDNWSEGVISNNICSSNGDGITGAPDQMIITGNICKNNADDGIDFIGGDKNLIVGNICLSNGTNLDGIGGNTQIGHNITA